MSRHDDISTVEDIFMRESSADQLCSVVPVEGSLTWFVQHDSHHVRSAWRDVHVDGALAWLACKHHVVESPGCRQLQAIGLFVLEGIEVVRALFDGSHVDLSFIP